MFVSPTSLDTFKEELGSTATRSTTADFTPTPKAHSGKLDGASRFGQVEPAVFSAQTGWEQRLKSLDHAVIDSLLSSTCRRPRSKELELLQGQVEVLREQCSFFTGELADFTKVVGELRQQRERDSAELGAVREQVRREQQDGQEEVMALVVSLHQLVAEHREESKVTIKMQQESHSSSMGELWSANRELWKESHRREQDHANLHDRMSASEESLTESANKLLSLQDSHLEYAELFSKHFQDFQALKGSHAQHAALPERLAFLEQLIGDSAECHASAPPDSQQTQSERLRGRSPGTRSGVLGWGRESDGAIVGEATLKGRLDEVERAFGLQADWHTDRQAEVESRFATLGEHVQILEQELRPSAAKMESLSNRMTLLRELWVAPLQTTHS